MVLNIAMDGPVGAGKSSIADAVAKRLGILHLDTGAMYRAIGLTALEKGVPVHDEQAVTALCQALSMTVGHAADGQHTLVDGRDVTGFIRTPEVSMAASTVAKYAGVRAAMVALQRRLAQETPMLVDGRDIGTRVLMNAPVKIFLTASAEEPAAAIRRCAIRAWTRISTMCCAICVPATNRTRTALLTRSVRQRTP